MKRVSRDSRRTVLWSLSVLVVLGLSVLLAAGCGKGKGAQVAQETQEEAGLPVTVAEATIGSLSETIEVTGTVKSLDEVSIGTTSPDKITYLCGREGATVKAGQVVARMDTGDLDASVAQASALVDGAKVALEQAREGHEYQDISLQNNIDTAENRLQLARNQLEQARTARDLLSKGVENGIGASKTQVAQAESGVQQAKIAVDTARLALSQASTGNQAGIDAAEAAVRQAQASYDDLKRGARSQQRAQAEENVRQAQLAVDNARTDLQRLTNLLASGAASQQTVDSARLQHDVAVSRLSQAQQALSLTNEGATPEQLRIAEQQIAQAQANLNNARSGSDGVEQRRQAVTSAEESVRIAEQTLAAARIGQTDAENKRLQVSSAEQDIANAQKAVEAAEIARNQAGAGSITLRVDEKEIARAQAALRSAQATVSLYSAQRAKRVLVSPVAGRISKLNSDVGEIGPAGSPLMIIVAEDALEFEATASELDVSRIMAGDTVGVTVDGLPDQKIEGRIVSVLPAGDAASRSFTLKISLPGESGVKPGMFARGEVRVRENPNAVIVPKDALVESSGTRFIFVVTPEGTARRCEVTTGLEGEGVIEIIEGVTVGDQVVIGGKETLSDGLAVKVTGMAEAPEGAAADLTSAAPESTVPLPRAEEGTIDSTARGANAG